MESSIDKSDDVNKRLDEIEKSVEKYNSGNWDIIKDINVIQKLAIKIVDDFVDILKVADNKINNRVCGIVDEISENSGTIWIFAGNKQNCGEPLMSYLKELARRNLVQSIDKIFMTRSGRVYPLVNSLSGDSETQNKFYQLFKMLPKDYQYKLLHDKSYYSPL